jgi:hypothetical protein
MDLMNLFCRSCWKWSICLTSKFLFMVKKIHLTDLIVQFLKIIHTVRWELLFFDKARSFKVHSVKWEIDRVRIFKFEEFIKFITLRKWAARLFISMNDIIVIIGLNSFKSENYEILDSNEIERFYSKCKELFFTFLNLMYLV